MGAELLIIREGHGEERAIETLIVRLLVDGLDPGRVLAHIPPAWRKSAVTDEQILGICRLARSGAPRALLITSDSEDVCPKGRAPQVSALIRAQNLPFPVAYLAFYREYETMAVACAAALAGLVMKTNLGEVVGELKECDTPEDPELYRDAKGWITRNLMPDIVYKPTVHQLALTRLLSPDMLRASSLSSVRRLESALRFLVAHVGTSGTAYP